MNITSHRNHLLLYVKHLAGKYRTLFLVHPLVVWAVFEMVRSVCSISDGSHRNSLRIERGTSPQLRPCLLEIVLGFRMHKCGYSAVVGWRLKSLFRYDLIRTCCSVKYLTDSYIVNVSKTKVYFSNFLGRAILGMYI